jgi:hypothetical protein
MNEVRPIVQHGAFAQWTDLDIIEKMGSLVANGTYSVDPASGMLKSNMVTATETPWVHVKHAVGKRCTMDHHLLFQCFRIIPKRCMSCWKVVVAPRTFAELMGLLQLQYELQVPAKCGIEVRPYTPRLYGGYFYTNSVEEGRDRHRQVREAVDKHISPDVKVILKRGCTEFEMSTRPGHGASPFWRYDDYSERIESIVEDRVMVPNNVIASQPDYLVAHVQRRWVQWAYAAGDETYKMVTDGLDLHSAPVVYHEGETEQVLADLAMAELQALGLGDVEQSKLLVDSAFSLCATHGPGYGEAVRRVVPYFRESMEFPAHTITANDNQL